MQSWSGSCSERRRKGKKMRLNRKKVELARARSCKSPRDLEEAGIPRGTWTAARSGKSVRPETAGRIAKALGVDVTEILEDEDIV